MDKNKITIDQLIKDDKFRDIVFNQVSSYLKRPNPGENLRYKRTGMDELIDITGANTDYIIALWVDVLNKRSNLSSRLRNTLQELSAQCISIYFNKYVKEDGQKEDKSSDSE